MHRMISILRRERLYILLAVFILLVNVAMMTPAPRKKAVTDTKPAVTEAAKASAEAASDESMLMKRAELERLFRENPSLAVAVNLATLLVLVVILLGLFIDVLLLSLRAEKKFPRIATYVPRGPVPWGIGDVARVVILFFFFAYLLVIAESFLALVYPVIKSDNLRMIANSALLDILAVVFIIYFSVRKYRQRLIALGLSLRDFTKNVLRGVVGYLAAVPVLVLVVIVTAIVVSALKYVPEKQAVVQLFMQEKDVRFLLFTSLFAAVGGPVIEEIFFRGFLYNALKKRIGIIGSMLATAAAFAALHAHPVGFAPIMVIGVLLAYLYEKTGTLVAPMTVHIIHNLTMVGFVFLLKGLGI